MIPPNQAVDRLAALHEQATGALSQALKRYLKDRTEPGADERALYRYPALRLTYYSHGEVAATTRAYAKVQVAGHLQRHRHPARGIPRLPAGAVAPADA